MIELIELHPLKKPQFLCFSHKLRVSQFLGGRSEIDVSNLAFDVHDSKNRPNQKIVFGLNPETHEIILATRVNPETGEMVWHVAGLRDLVDVLGMTIGTQLYSPNNGLFSHSDVQKINALAETCLTFAWQNSKI